MQEKMKFPDDYLSDESLCLPIAELFLSIFKELKTAEVAKAGKGRDKSTVLDPTQPTVCLLESNDFELFENILKVRF